MKPLEACRGQTFKTSGEIERVVVSKRAPFAKALKSPEQPTRRRLAFPLFDAVISLWDEHVQQRLKLAAAELEQSDYLGSLSLAGGV